MKIIQQENPNELLAVDENDKVIGTGYIYEFQASDLYSKNRMNYFIEAVSDHTCDSDTIRTQLTHELISHAKELRAKYPDYDARVYHCCFADDTEQIKFYSQFEGFNTDEAMHLLQCDLEDFITPSFQDMSFTIKEDCLNTEEDIQKMIAEHSKIFVSHPYELPSIKELQEKEGFKNIAFFDKDIMIANILVHIEDTDEGKVGWLEDMFVNKEYRNKGLGRYLVLRALDYFKQLGLRHSKLEVWSSNERAPKLYEQVGYKLIKETEVSIGKSI